MMMKTGSIVAVAAVAVAMSVTPAAAQNADCRCVDRDGNRIERCSCFRAPHLEGLGSSFGFTDSRPRLGISVDARQSARRDALGALVTDVLEGGPAQAVGIRRNDVIVRIGAQSLFDPLAGSVEDDFDLDQSVPVQRLLAIAAELEPGEEVEVEYLRGDESHTALVVAEDLSDSWGRSFTVVAPDFDADRLRGQLRSLSEGARSLRFRSDARDGADVRLFGRGDTPLVIDRLQRAYDGLELVELNPSLGSYFGVEAGVLVADVEEGSTLGLEPGDVVLRVGDREVTTPARMSGILRSYEPSEEIVFHIRRDGAAMSVTGRLGG